MHAVFGSVFQIRLRTEPKYIVETDELGQRQSRCWCGNESLDVFSADYLRCSHCETLTVVRMPAATELLAGEDERGFYGHTYFDTYQVERLGLPPIRERASLDLRERCVHWLRTLLRYKRPPAKVLELGSAHGGFVALMRWTGFDAAGLELSPRVAAFARQAFGVPVLEGPIEQQTIEAASLDAIVLMDVLEHLPDPIGTLQHSVRLLKPGGILLIQTPSYREGKTLEAMVADGDRFQTMLLPEQHLHLFSKKSVTELLRRLGFGYVQFEPAIFPAYDMFLVAATAQLSVISDREAREILASRPEGRLVGALLDLRSELQDLTGLHLESEADRAARLTVIESQGRQLIDLDRSFQSLRSEFQEFQKRLDQSEAGRVASLAKLEESERSRVASLARLEESETSRAELLATLEQCSSLSAQLGEERDDLRRQLEEARTRADERAAALAAAECQLQKARSEARSAQEALQRLSGSYVYALMRRLALWGWLAEMIESRLPAERVPERGKSPARGLKRVVVDLTPVLPGGENGGAKVMTLELVRQLSSLARDCQFILLTSDDSHDELSSLDCGNVRRLCVQKRAGQLPSPPLERAVNRVLAPLARLTHRPAQSSLPRRLKADLVFCPFTAPFFFDPRIPLVSVVYDLQHLYYPQFFEPGDRSQRDRNFREACRAATRLVCISDHVRKTVLDSARLALDRVETVHISLPNRLGEPPSEARQRVLDRYGLAPGRFLLYPANFWPHKNHEMLLTAFGIYKSRHPESEMKLVLTGAPSARMQVVREAAGRMGLDRSVVFSGFLPDEEFGALLYSCLAVIFPSLYEGFGMPVVEAMAAGRPVLCSNVASLPEVAGGAALLFDPRKPTEICAAIERISGDQNFARELVRRGHRRAAAFGPLEMANAYLRIFKSLAGQPVGCEPGVYGLYSDGWASGRIVLKFNEAEADRKVVLQLTLPEWAPIDSGTARLRTGTAKGGEVVTLPRGRLTRIERALPREGGFLEVVFEPVFQPRACGCGDDIRWISCRYDSAHIVSQDGTATALKADSDGA